MTSAKTTQNLKIYKQNLKYIIFIKTLNKEEEFFYHSTVHTGYILCTENSLQRKHKSEIPVDKPNWFISFFCLFEQTMSKHIIIQEVKNGHLVLRLIKDCGRTESRLI